MRLIRIADNRIASYGVLIHDRTPFAVSLERPWRNNERNVSCIPPGTYECRRVKSPRFGETFQVMDVPGRSQILFHKGNIDADTHGCICVGEAFNPVLGKPGITQSGEGFSEFLGLLRMTDRFALSVIAAYPALYLQDVRA